MNRLWRVITAGALAYLIAVPTGAMVAEVCKLQGDANWRLNGGLSMALVSAWIVLADWLRFRMQPQVVTVEADTRLPDLSQVPTLRRISIPASRPPRFEAEVEVVTPFDEWAHIASADKLPGMIRQLAALPDDGTASTRTIRGLSRGEVHRLQAFLTANYYATPSRGAAKLTARGRAAIAELLPYCQD